MQDKKKFNWLIPTPIYDAMDPCYQGLNEKQKWLVGSAALLMFLEASDEQRKSLIGKVAAANVTGDIESLVEEAIKKSASTGAIDQPIGQISKSRSPSSKAARQRRSTPKGRGNK